MSGKNYRDLIVWQKAIELVVEIYRLTQTFPKEELYCLTSQIRRAAISIPSNIAEGQGRRTKKEFANFLSFAHGSLRETETQLTIAQRLGYAKPTTVEATLNRCAEIGRLLNGLSNSLASPPM
ncbi:MAG: four helix bundle protein [Pirellulales bacterium]|nr:four helix bundle protein [Pirellulales bacterium]